MSDCTLTVLTLEVDMFVSICLATVKPAPIMLPSGLNYNAIDGANHDNRANASDEKEYTSNGHMRK